MFYADNGSPLCSAAFLVPSLPLSHTSGLQVLPFAAFTDNSSGLMTDPMMMLLLLVLILEMVVVGIYWWYEAEVWYCWVGGGGGCVDQPGYGAGCRWLCLYEDLAGDHAAGMMMRQKNEAVHTTQEDSAVPSQSWCCQVPAYHCTWKCLQDTINVLRCVNKSSLDPQWISSPSP